ncbi:MAG: molybdopterin-dependent oxidoreductase [Sneathiella sp.]
MFSCRKNALLFMTILSLILLPTGLSFSLEKPTSAILLEISGNISVFNTDMKKAVFDRSLLRQFKRVTIQTHTPWTDGLTTFEGILIRDILQAVGAQGQTIEATAINDYSVPIPIKDFMNHDVILADTRNGTTMSVRDKGPLWIIYPWDSNPELRTEIYHSRSIWQLHQITIK